VAKQLKYDKEARAKLITGVNTVAKAVVTTLGPKGRNVALDKKWGAPSVVHDGVSVAKEIELEDPFENMGAQLVKEAASKTNDVVGDGTTTATILAQAIVAYGFEVIDRGENPIELKKEIDEGVKHVVEKLEEMAKPVKGKDEITQVATISAADPEIGKLIAESLEKVGKDGVVTVEEGKGLQMEIEYKEGMEFDKGFASPYFITDPEKMEATVEDAHILITDKKISALNDLLPFLEKIVQVTKNLVIIADEIEGEALATMVVNKLRGTINVLAVKAPGFGDRRKAMLDDIAILTGGTVISEDVGRKIESVEVSDLGQADRVTSDKENTIIVGGKGEKAKIDGRIAQIKREIKDTESDFDREKLDERLAKLSGGVAVVKVGAATEVEMKEKKERVTDAVQATKAAVEEGIIPGGGIALFRAREVLVVRRTKEVEKGKVFEFREHEYPGWTILYQALEAPLRSLLRTALPSESEVQKEVIALQFTDKGESWGYDVASGQEVDLLKSGIIDPVKVTKSALQNAASVSTMILTTDGLVTDIPEKEKTPPMPPGGGMGEY